MEGEGAAASIRQRCSHQREKPQTESNGKTHPPITTIGTDLALLAPVEGTHRTIPGTLPTIDIATQHLALLAAPLAMDAPGALERTIGLKTVGAVLAGLMISAIPSSLSHKRTYNLGLALLPRNHQLE